MTENMRRSASVWHPQPSGKIEPPVDAETVARLKQEYYANFDFEAFERRVEAFDQLDLTDPDVDVPEAVRHVLRPETGPGYLLLPFSWDEIPSGTLLWRARSMDGDVLRKGDIVEDDLWEPPHQHVKSGRFNRENEPLLYTCIGQPMGALTEARIDTFGAPFILVCYEVEEPVYVRRLGVSNADDTLSAEQQIIEEKVSRFLAEVMSTPIEDKGPDTYKFTQLMLHELCSLEPGWESGWIYGSTLSGPELLNVALEPEDAHARLIVSRVVAGSMAETPDGRLGTYLAGYSDGKPAFGSNISFWDYPHEQFSSLQDYFDFLWPDGNDS